MPIPSTGEFAIRNRKEALDFARENGFDINDPHALEKIFRVHRESIEFIEEYLLNEDQRHLISEDVRHPEHVVDLLVYSSNYLNKSNLKQKWACAVLKVMHGIFHMDHDSKLMYFDEIRKQIFESIDRTILYDGEGYFLKDDQVRIPLFFFEKKRNKGRKSILLKLLQKPSYVASDIYDHLGIRLVFETKAECLFALKALRRSHIISVSNIKPFRSRNNLLDLALYKKVFNRFRPLLNRSENYPLDVLKRMDEELSMLHVNKSRANNPHSSIHFQAIQVTVRKMIRIANPVYRRMQELIEFLENKLELPEHFKSDTEIDKELSFYFDYEIQLLDKTSYLNSLHGPASHEAYKRRQVETARKRVLGNELIKYLEKTGSRKEGGVCV